jgi:hypothetical protein
MYPREYIMYRRSHSHAPILVNSYERVAIGAMVSDVLMRIADGMTERDDGAGVNLLAKVGVAIPLAMCVIL